MSETCRGEAATIVGTPGKPVLGTPGDDVIVSNLAGSVAAGDGDDLICLSPTQDDELQGMVVKVDAGAGDDVVISEGAQNHSDTDLGPGRDEFQGGGWEDRVEASLDDVVVAGDDDYVKYSIAPGESLPATIGSMSGSRTGGWIQVIAPGRSLSINAEMGIVRLGGRVVTTLPIAPRTLFGVAQRVELIGTARVDRFGTAACGRSVLVGRGGNDEIFAIDDPATSNRECPRRHMSAFGGGGDDDIRGTRRDDDLHGGSGNDYVIGYRGQDLVDGSRGRDECVGERERHCER